MTEGLPRSDELQPLSETQIKQVREFVDEKEKQRLADWISTLPVGKEVTWERRITPEAVILYADGVEDYNPWYEAPPFGKGQSPFGPAIAPPLMLSQMCEYFTLAAGGTSTGGIQVNHDSQILAPVPIGTLVRFRGKLLETFIKRGRHYLRREITVEDADTGKLLFKETREALIQYKRTSE